MSVFSDVGGWVEDQVTIPGLLRLASGATVFGAIGPVAQLVGYLPLPLQRAADVFITATPSLVEGKDLQQAIVAEYVYQGQRAAAAYAASAAGNAPLLDQARNVGVTVPPEVASGGQAAQDFMRSAAGSDFAARVVNKAFAEPIQKAIDGGLRSVMASAKAEANQTGENLYRTLERKRLSPEALAAQANARPDAMAIAANLAAGQHLYDIDWFDPASGQPITDPSLLSRVLAVARHRLASPAVLEEIRRRYLKAAGLPFEDVGTRAHKIADPLRDKLLLIPPEQLATPEQAFQLWTYLEAIRGPTDPGVVAYKQRYADLLSVESQGIDAADAAKSSSTGKSVLHDLAAVALWTSPVWGYLWLWPKLKGKRR